MLRRWMSFACALMIAPLVARGDFTSTYENTGLAVNSINAGATAAGSFTIDGNRYNNSYDPTYGLAGGWAISSKTGLGTSDYNSPYNSSTGGGGGVNAGTSSATYMVGFTYGAGASGEYQGDPASPGYIASNPFHPSDTYLTLAAGMSALSIQLTNTAYTYSSLANGDLFNTKFGAGDYQLLDIRGYDASGHQVGVVNFFLADFTSRNSASWYVVNQWTTVNLSSLAGATTLQFGIQSSRNDTAGGYGVLTPAYFAADNFVFGATPAVVPEPSSLLLVGIGLTVSGLFARRRRATR